MTRIAVAILGVCGLLVATGRAQALGEFSDEEAPVDLGQNAFDRGAGLHCGPLRISPELSLSYTHDTNPTYSEKNAKASDTIRMQPLLDLILNGNGWSSYGRAWLTRDWQLGAQDSTYADTIEKQHYGETVGFNLETPRGTRFSLTEFYEYQNRNNYVPGSSPSGIYNASWQDRYSFILGASADTRLGEKTGMSLGASYSDLWYDNPALYGWKDVGGTLGFSRKLTEKSDMLLDFGADNQWSEGSSGESRSYRALIGVGSRPTAKSSYRAEIGVMGYDYNSGSQTAVGWTYNLSGDWHLSQRLSANVSGSANFQPSETDQNNYTMVQSLAAGLTFEATRRITTTLSAIYRREDYANADPGMGKRLDNQFSLYGRANYRLFRYTSLFVGADFSKNRSSINEWSYNRLFLEAGVNLRF